MRTGPTCSIAPTSCSADTTASNRNIYYRICYISEGLCDYLTATATAAATATARSCANISVVAASTTTTAAANNKYFCLCDSRRSGQFARTG
jgi:hypothetical protein